jgi:hypothetical protein
MMMRSLKALEGISGYELSTGVYYSVAMGRNLKVTHENGRTAKLHVSCFDLSEGRTKSALLANLMIASHNR